MSLGQGGRDQSDPVRCPDRLSFGIRADFDGPHPVAQQGGRDAHDLR